MPRPARFDNDAILDVALRVAHEHGPSGLTTEALAREMGGNVGSIYYRFPSRDHVLAQLWMRCIRIGQAGMLTALGFQDVDTSLEAAALHYLRWSRTDLPVARILTMYSPGQLVSRWPDDLQDEFRTLNTGLLEATSDFTRRWYGDASKAHRQTVAFALLDLPVAAVRPYLTAGKRPPRHLDETVLAAARSALQR